MKINKYMFLPALIAIGLASCNGEGDGNVQMWEWETPEVPAEVDPYVEKGWTNVTKDYGEMPEYIRVYSSPAKLQDKDVKAFIAVADATMAKFDVVGGAEGYSTPSEFYAADAAPIIINGGFFYDGSSLSLVWREGTLVCPNVQVDSPDWTETWYYMPRGVFAKNSDGKYEVGWTWTDLQNHTYWYPTPMPLENGRVPDASYPSGGKEFQAVTAIGGGPVLVKGNEIINSYEDEYLLINPTGNRPRTAIGYNSTTHKLVLFVCEGDGMTSGIAGMTLEDVANVMKDLGCDEACNLDGGGSSCMLVNGKETIKPSDGEQRSVVNGVAIK